MLKPVQKKSLADAVFEQLRDEIVSGRMEPGTALPAERALCDMLDVNRGAVREALKKLEQAKLVSIQHGGATRVLDFRETAGLDLIAALVMDAHGRLDADVLHGVMELRSALATDIARRCATRGRARAGKLFEIVTEMEETDDLKALLDLNMAFWSELVDGSANVAYRLAYNSVRELLAEFPAVFASMLVDEITDVDAHRRIAEAVQTGEVDDAEFYARDLIERGELRVGKVADRMKSGGEA